MTEHTLDFTNTFQSVLHRNISCSFCIIICVFDAHLSAQAMHCFHDVPCHVAIMRYLHRIQFRIHHIYHFTSFPAEALKTFDLVNEVFLNASIHVGQTIVSWVHLQALVKIITRNEQFMVPWIPYPSKQTMHIVNDTPFNVDAY